MFDVNGMWNKEEEGIELRQTLKWAVHLSSENLEYIFYIVHLSTIISLDTEL